jgi:hemerythrin superfamily protein
MAVAKNMRMTQARDVVAGAAAGLVAGLALTAGRKLLTQGMEAAAGDWFSVLKAEHLAVMKLFDKLEQIADQQAAKRGAIFLKIKAALSKHAFQEESVIYPALRKADTDGAAKHLNEDHFEMKALLSEGEQMDKASPEFVQLAKRLRTLIETHVREEEDQIFPALQSKLDAEENKKLTLLMHKEGVKLA